MKTNPKEFRVPPSTALFAALGDNEDRDMEWGIPRPLRIERSGHYVYSQEDRDNVLQCIMEVAQALHGGSDCNRQAGQILAWVRKQGHVDQVTGEQV